MGHINHQKPRSMLFCYTYDLVCNFVIFSQLILDRHGWVCAVGGDKKVEQYNQRVLNGPGGATRNVSVVAEYTAQHSPSHIQPKCGETAGLCSRVAESLLSDSQCGCATA